MACQNSISSKLQREDSSYNNNLYWVMIPLSEFINIISWMKFIASHDKTLEYK